jgi:ABC-type uncharacterized transport system substrate-binding protein
MPAFAHPHIFIDGGVQLVFDSQGQIVSLRQSWKFDELFAAYALQGLPRTKGGEVAPDELEKITKEWMTALADPESHFFTEAMQGTNKFAFGTAKDAATTWDVKTGQLTLSFELPFVKPIIPGKQAVEVDISDSSYFVAFAYKGSSSYRLEGAPQSCRINYLSPRPLDPKTERLLWSIPADQKELPPELKEVTKQLSHQFKVTC